MLFGYEPSTLADAPVCDADPGSALRGLGDGGVGAREGIRGDGEEARPRVADLRPGGQVADVHLPGRGPGSTRTCSPLSARPSRSGGRAGRRAPSGPRRRLRPAPWCSGPRRRRRSAGSPRVANFPGRDELHRPAGGRVVDLDLVVDVRIGDMDALGIAAVEDGDASVGELRRDGALRGRLLLERRVRAGERIRRDREVRLAAPDGDARGQVADVDLPGLAPRELVGVPGPPGRARRSAGRSRVASLLQVLPA